MDTTEELNNTYYYHGHGNLTAGELFNLIFLENFSSRTGLEITAAALILSGQPYLKVSGKLSAATATPGTSVASRVSRALLRDLRFPYGLRPLTPMGKNLATLKMVPTNKIASFVGRYIPWIGYVQLIAIMQLVARDTRRQYNLIARPEDRIEWTYF
ncbi:hypothetical protein H4F38_20765 [Pectobacterium brasiliense]|uniref:STM2901 family protein n=1 Tax=Pectobacterium actinidiae TaxID=1507808 RepID=A0A1V2R8B1_9GAMM|nr:MULTISPECIES: hypothetical protein [Pectobacterium]GLY60264.1 hypothetical protein Pcaca05_11220 [Pectobacterium carotovorum subsp. carotovorum]KFF68140.1 membrane protein [Pectobacterium brasiliense]KHN90540.1 hypothetical protein KKH3_05670 [Pectobacterium actinidiae]MBN3100179.1 hypothetical protein [Pectobacterium brasiliense]MBN3167261.1 hypothetical protein [Pectobacterium brasiliense]